MTTEDSLNEHLSTETGLTDLMTSGEWSLVAKLIFGQDHVRVSSPSQSNSLEESQSTFFWPLEDWESWKQ
jgi:hypothetical protein